MKASISRRSVVKKGLRLLSEPIVGHYGNIRSVDFLSGMVFDSRLEARRWNELDLLQKQGEITGLRRQVKVPIIVEGVEVSHSRIDHVYEKDGVTVYEETKGFLNDVQKLRYKILKAQGLNLIFFPERKI